jgi:hypothetical protein
MYAVWSPDTAAAVNAAFDGLFARCIARQVCLVLDSTYRCHSVVLSWDWRPPFLLLLIIAFLFKMTLLPQSNLTLEQTRIEEVKSPSQKQGADPIRDRNLVPYRRTSPPKQRHSERFPPPPSGANDSKRMLYDRLEEETGSEDDSQSESEYSASEVNTRSRRMTCSSHHQNPRLSAQIKAILQMFLDRTATPKLPSPLPPLLRHTSKAPWPVSSTRRKPPANSLSTRKQFEQWCDWNHRSNTRRQGRTHEYVYTYPKSKTPCLGRKANGEPCHFYASVGQFCRMHRAEFVILLSSLMILMRCTARRRTKGLHVQEDQCIDRSPTLALIKIMDV